MGWLFWQQKREEPSAPAASAVKGDEPAVAETAPKKKICCACPETKVCWASACMEHCIFWQALSQLSTSLVPLAQCSADSLCICAARKG